MATATGKKIELKNIKYAAFASTDSYCFSCSVYVDGKRAGTAFDDGNGGDTRIDPASLITLLNDEAKIRFPNETMSDGTPFECDAGVLVNALMNDYLMAREAKRSLSKKVIFTVINEKGLRNTKTLKPELMKKILNNPDTFKSQMKAKHNMVVGQILNLMPLDEATAIFSANDGE